MRKLTFLKAALAGLVMTGAMTGVSHAADIVGLITKTEGNPFFVKMREGAQAKAKELGLDLRTFAGKFDGDNDSQVAAIENLIAAGAKGFAIVPSDSTIAAACSPISIIGWMPWPNSRRSPAMAFTPRRRWTC